LNSVAAGVSPADREATDTVATTEGAPMLWERRVLPRTAIAALAKHEIRNPKLESNSKFENDNIQNKSFAFAHDRTKDVH
jgi:hypothetical protein